MRQSLRLPSRLLKAFAPLPHLLRRASARRASALAVAASMLAVVLVLPGVPTSSASTLLFFEDFSTDPTTNGNWMPVRYAGDAANELSWTSASDPFYLTRAQPWKAGALFANYALTERFWEASFMFRIEGGDGADGITMPFFADTTVAPGLNNGFGGPGYAIELDVHPNAEDPTPLPHIALIENDAATHLAWTPAPVLLTPGWHRATVLFTSGFISVDVDGTNLFASVYIPMSHPYTGIGLAASTGARTNNHMVDDFSLHSVANSFYCFEVEGLPPGIYTDFSTDPNYDARWSVHRHASDPASEVVWDAAGELHLTTATPGRGGALFWKEPTPSGEWIAFFRFRITGEGLDADGISLPFYAKPGVKDGEAAGFAGPGFAVELDTYPNALDPTNKPHVALVMDYGLGPIHHAFNELPDFADGKWHNVSVKRTVGSILVWMDNRPVLMTDISNFAPPDVGIGIAASTGAVASTHSLDEFGICPAYVPPDSAAGANVADASDLVGGPRLPGTVIRRG